MTYLWAEPGTESIHLPQTHEIIKLLRDVIDAVAPGVALVTETNVAHCDNVAYFGDGYDEAHMVYNFALPPLVLLALYRGDASALSQWAQRINPPSDRTAYLNILDTHDGIGLMGVNGILSPEDIRYITNMATERGAQISYKRTGEHQDEPYEINSTWWSVVNPTNVGETLEFQVRRYIASRSIALVLRGVPGIYIHGALGTSNDYDMLKKTGVKRDLNRSIVDIKHVMECLWDPNSKLSLLLRHWMPLIQVRRQERSFHPQGRTARIVSIFQGFLEFLGLLRKATSGFWH